jgi:hypothetical protein
MLRRHETDGGDRATAIVISDPLLDDATILISASLMAFNAVAYPKPGEMVPVCERDILPSGDGA